MFGWFKSTRLSLTRLRLLPGRYRWRVVVVRGRDENRVELSGYSQTGIFVLEQPGVVASTITPDIDDADRATATPTAVRTATATLTRVVVPTRLPPTRVVVPPTAIPSMTPTVPDDPTETVTPEDPAETPTSDDTPTTPTETAVTPDSPMATSTPFPDELPTTTVTQEAYPNPWALQESYHRLPERVSTKRGPLFDASVGRGRMGDIFENGSSGRGAMV